MRADQRGPARAVAEAVLGRQGVQLRRRAVERVRPVRRHGGAGAGAGAARRAARAPAAPVCCCARAPEAGEGMRPRWHICRGGGLAVAGHVDHVNVTQHLERSRAVACFGEGEEQGGGHGWATRRGTRRGGWAWRCSDEALNGIAAAREPGPCVQGTRPLAGRMHEAPCERSRMLRRWTLEPLAARCERPPATRKPPGGRVVLMKQHRTEVSFCTARTGAPGSWTPLGGPLARQGPLPAPPIPASAATSARSTDITASAPRRTFRRLGLDLDAIGLSWTGQRVAPGAQMRMGLVPGGRSK